MSRYDEYRKRYRNIEFERRGGVVQMRIHTDGGALQWGSNEGIVQGQLCDAFRDVARDPDLRVLFQVG